MSKTDLQFRMAKPFLLRFLLHFCIIIVLISDYSKGWSALPRSKTRKFAGRKENPFNNTVFTSSRNGFQHTNIGLYISGSADVDHMMHSQKQAPIIQSDQLQKSTSRKIIDGLKVAPAVATLPLYGVGFGIIGPKHMWKFSKWIYGLSSPSDNVLHTHFDRIAAYLYSEKKIASKKLISYKLHPLFAGLSLISTALLAFGHSLSCINILSYRKLLFVNMIICFISAVAAFPLHKLMLGNLNAKKWILIQGKASMMFAALSLTPGAIGRLMVHLNWAVLFAGGALERIYVLCIMSQLKISDRKTYLAYYSPQIKAATLGGIALGLASYKFFG